MLYTTNYGLSKPEAEDIVDIEPISNNFDIIDTKMAENHNQIAKISNKNLVIDGGFQVWSDGEEFLVDENMAYTATMWAVAESENATISKGNDDTYINTFKWISGDGNARMRIFHYFNDEMISFLQGKTITISFYCRHTTQSSVVPYVAFAGNTISIDEISTEWQKTTRTVVCDFSVDEDYYNALMFTTDGTNVYEGGTGLELAQIKVEYGENATPFIFEIYSDVIDSISPYYEQSWVGYWEDGTENVENCQRILAGANDTVRFSRQKHIVPTMTFYSTASKVEGMQTTFLQASFTGSVTYGSASLNVMYIGKNSFTTFPTETANLYGKNMRAYQWKSDARIYPEEVE